MEFVLIVSKDWKFLVIMVRIFPFCDFFFFVEVISFLICFVGRNE